MGKGRKNIPTHLKILRGNPGRRPLPETEPHPDITDKVPDPPKYLDDIARDEWLNMAPKLHALKLLTELDITALAAYCKCFSVWVQANNMVSLMGDFIVGSKGSLVQNPAVSTAKHAEIELRRWLVEFGMTPASRTKVQVPTKKKNSDLEAFLNKKRGQHAGPK